MAAAVVERLGDRIDDGCIVVPHRAAISLRVRVVHGSHPLPDEEAMRGAAEILSLAENADERDLVIVVLSGGGSALLPLPVEGVSLNDLRRTTDALLRAGADVYELNTVRKHLSRIQGGRLARAAVPATIVTLVLSDVAGNQLDVVGSGPTHPDPTTFAAAWDALSKYGLAEEPRPDGVNEVAGCEETPLEAARIAPPGRAVKPRRDPSRIPAAVLAHLQRGLRGEIEETPKPGDAAFARAHSCVVADNRIALEAMRRHGESQGLSTFVLDDPVRGEAREAGAALGRMLHTSHDATGLEVADPAGRTICVLFGGETTVTVRGGGRGGRNQELAVGAALELAAAPDPGSVVLLAAGTDGIDGNSEAAGGLVDGTTIMRAERLHTIPGRARGSRRHRPHRDECDGCGRGGGLEGAVPRAASNLASPTLVVGDPAGSERGNDGVFGSPGSTIPVRMDWLRVHPPAWAAGADLANPRRECHGNVRAENDRSGQARCRHLRGSGGRPQRHHAGDGGGRSLGGGRRHRRARP